LHGFCAGVGQLQEAGRFAQDLGQIRSFLTILVQNRSKVPVTGQVKMLLVKSVHRKALAKITLKGDFCQSLTVNTFW